MFIPNKTVNLIKTGALLILSALVVIIVGQAVLYIKMSNDTNKKMDQFVSQMDSLGIATKKFDTTSFKKHQSTEVQLVDINKSVDSLIKTVNILNQTAQHNTEVIDLLVRNECNVRPYYIEKSLLAMCK